MTLFEAVLLGIIQGLTEFLPISSTAHLTVAGTFLGLISPEALASWTAFLAVVQLGTLLAVIVYFFRDLLQMPRSLAADFRKNGLSMGLTNYDEHSRTAVFLCIGTIPIGLAGLFLSDFLHGVFTKNLVVIGSSLILLGLLLFAAEKKARHTRTIGELTFRDAVVVGIAQAFALIPGSSRSGTTITAGLFLNLTRHAAARFSFLLMVPAVSASGIYEMFSLDADPFRFGVLNLGVATLVSALTGYAAIAWLLRYLMRRTTMLFVWYRVLVGSALLGAVASGIIKP